MAQEALHSKVPIVERQSLCISSQQPGVALQCGENGFAPNLARIYPSAENNAAEALSKLKVELRTADTETFWKRLMEGLTEMTHSQYGFVAKRILADDHDSAIEMPQYGEQGSCLMGVAFYYNDGDKIKAMHRDYKFMAWGAPCSYMKHDKVFLIPENMSQFILHNPNALPFAAEGYLAVPLFSDGKCFAHFGVMFSQKGLDNREISWTFMEMIMHSLEDLIIERLLRGSLDKAPITRPTEPPEQCKVVPHDAVSNQQSFRPYAKSLSHELRTPMHGVVGMLDIMHATVEEQLEGQSNQKVRNIFKLLKENIEVVQDSSKRAVEAADNVVHAYDLNMQIPDTPLQDVETPSHSSYFDQKLPRRIEGSNISVNPYKRRRSSPTSWQFGTATKIRNTNASPQPEPSPKSESDKFTPLPQKRPPLQDSYSDLDYLTTHRPHLLGSAQRSVSVSMDLDGHPSPGHKNSHMRELIPFVINESLRVGGRPDSAISEPTSLGERIEVRSRSSNGVVAQKVIEWSVTEDIPEVILVDERDLSKLISAVFLNAIKFTEHGKISLNARLSDNRRYIMITITDTGAGIPQDFQPELFKPFSREDDSLTRSKDGLGLGLLVAKGLARRIGGDITLVRSEISGSNQGSEFEIKVPLDASDPVSRAATPLRRSPELPQVTCPPPSVPSNRSKSMAQTLAPRFQGAWPPLQPTTPAKENSRSLNFSKLNSDARPATIRTLTSSPKAPSKNRNAYDRKLAEKYPLTFLIAEDNKINRKLLVNMLAKFGYKDIYEAFDGKEAVRIMDELYGYARRDSDQKHTRSLFAKKVDVILMDLWMPEMDGYQATEKILEMFEDVNPQPNGSNSKINGTVLKPGPPTILAVSADVTDEALNRATRSGMEGFMTKPYKLMDLQRLIEDFCIKHNTVEI